MRRATYRGELRVWTDMQIARRVIRALMTHRGNFTDAAAELGVVRPYLYQVWRGKGERMVCSRR